ncbi:hypothetical protein OG381_45775 [Streptomyces sp. NBC_00490]|uniref:hypothetical protein n=1 Tax=Streptomyces sp. NBC_00490 TaxID=2903657 RepID=UPI002E19F5A3
MNLRCLRKLPERSVRARHPVRELAHDDLGTMAVPAPPEMPTVLLAGLIKEGAPHGESAW